jgi:AbrB family looped-hinge helix DNA binding protein
MPTKVLKNGRITVPKQIRDYLDLEPGTGVAFRRSPTVVSYRKSRRNPIAGPLGSTGGLRGSGPHHG